MPNKTNKEFVFTRNETIELKYSWNLSEEDWPDFINWASYESDTAEAVLKGLSFKQALAKYQNIKWSKRDGTMTSLEDAIISYLRDIAQQRGEEQTGFDFHESLSVN